jgi:hypothetical protein
MEEGSLLAEALSRGRRSDTALKNVLLVDVFLPRFAGCTAASDEASSVAHLLDLAAQASRLNRFLQQQTYPWIQGGDGPVFGVHVDVEGVPHLRCQCRYGVSVADEWALIGYLLAYTAASDEGNDDDDDDRKNSREDLVVECWDEDDGQVLLIEASSALPLWVDDVGPAACRYRCWIQRGRVVLLAPTATTADDRHGSNNNNNNHLTRREAIRLLHSRSSACQRLSSVDSWIKERTTAVLAQNQDWRHRAAVALPRAVAHLLQERPQLISLLVTAWADAVQGEESFETTGPQSPALPTALQEDYTWTLLSPTRLAYAQCRSLQGPTWESWDHIPARYHSPSLRRLAREGRNEATVHLQHGVGLGVRLVAGLDRLLLSTTLEQEPLATISSLPATKQSLFGSPVEERVLGYWTQIDAACARQGDWLREAWVAGPQQAVHSLEHVTQCPVFQTEVHNAIHPLAHPGESFRQLIQTGLKRALHTEASRSPPPSRDQVDTDETWMTLPAEDDEMQRVMGGAPQEEKEEEEHMAQQVLDGVHTFMAGESTEKGVEHKVASHKVDPKGVEIRPAAFLYLLRETLAAPTVPDLEAYLREMPQAVRDPYFAEEDYTLLEPDHEEDDEGEEFLQVMEQMDEELARATNASRSFDPVTGADGSQLAEDAHVLSNLLSSVDASAGGPGPVRNMLDEMGKQQ